MKKLIPPFLKKLDDYFLLNYPLLWISKLHYVLFYGVCMLIFSTAVGFIIPLNLSQTQDLGLWYFLFTILSIIALCFWIYRNVIFNIEKKFGLRKWTDEYKVFFLNFACVLMFMSFPLPFTSIYNSRLAEVVTDVELIEDINYLNQSSPFIVNDLNSYESFYDSTSQSYFYDIKKLQRYDDYTPWHIRYDTLKFKNLLSSFQLEKSYGTHKKSDAEILTLINKHISIITKYGYKFNSTSEFELKTYNELYEKSPISINSFNYRNIGSKYELTRCIENIADAKFNTLFIWKMEFLHFLFYATFYITLLVMLFKMVNWRQYLITAIALILIPIILFIISQLLPYSTNYRVRENAYTVLLSIVFFTSLVFTVLSFNENSRFNAFRNICAQIVYLTIPIFPMLFVYLLKSVTNVFGPSAYDAYPAIASSAKYAEETWNTTSSYYNTAEYIYSQLLADYWRHQYDLWFLGVMYGAMIVFVLILVPLMKQLFVKQLALPRNS